MDHPADSRVLHVVPQKLTRFEYDTSYAPMNTSEFFTDEVLQKWNNLMPSTYIFISTVPRPPVPDLHGGH